ncbi:MAG: hypothetical protein AAGA46_12395 [Cyanobacteria bacterium P01_F01_bin.13]
MSVAAIISVFNILGLAVSSPDLHLAERGSGRSISTEQKERGSGRLTTDQAYRGSGRFTADQAYRGSGRFIA